MKRLFLLALATCILGTTMAGTDPDTVVIELSNKSKIIIYTENKEELENLERYDINKMIEDLNGTLSSDEIESIELQDRTGKRYSRDTTIIIGDSDAAKTKIRIGNMELLVDADDWDDIDDEFERSFRDDTEFRKYSYDDYDFDRTDHNFQIDIGLNNWIDDGQFPDSDDQPYTLRPFGSWTFALNSIQKTYVSGPLFLEWGAGVSWHNFKLQDSDYQFIKGDDNLELVAVPEDYNTRKSRLTVPYANVSFVPVLDFAKGRKRVKNYEKGGVTFRSYRRQGIRIGFGGYAGYRLGGQAKLVYTQDGDKEKDKDSGNFYLNNFRYGLRGQFGYKGLDLFVTYDLNTVFSENRGPAGSSGLQAISFGISL